MTKLEYLLMYQKADLKKQQLENSLRTTESRQKLNKITKLLREQQATIQKLTEDDIQIMYLVRESERIRTVKTIVESISKMFSTEE